jgi:hypothetical protein
MDSTSDHLKNKTSLSEPVLSEDDVFSGLGLGLGLILETFLEATDFELIYLVDFEFYLLMVGVIIILYILDRLFNSGFNYNLAFNYWPPTAI